MRGAASMLHSADSMLRGLLALARGAESVLRGRSRVRRLPGVFYFAPPVEHLLCGSFFKFKNVFFVCFKI